MLLKTKFAGAFSVALLGSMVTACGSADDNADATGSVAGGSGSTSDGGANNNATGSKHSNTQVPNNDGTGGKNSHSTGNASTGGSAGPINGNAGGSGSTGGEQNHVCADTPRNSESCTNAVQWGFCGQGWFAGFCEVSCGVCSTGGGNNTGGSGNGNSTSNSVGGSGNTNPGATGGSGNTSNPGATGGNGNTNPGATGGRSASTGGAGSSGGGDSAGRVDNPYVGVTGYINPEWKKNADSEPGGDRVSNNPTGIWLDRIAAIDGSGSASSMGMKDHLDEALKQGAGYIQFVIYDLPGRDCAALASNGELGPDEIDRYKHEYIDPIVAIESDARYASIRIINIVEIDSLPNLVTNTGSKATATPTCDVMKANGNYQKGVQYALSQFHKIPNVYNYVDAGHHGWIGWDDNMNNSASLFAETVQGAEGGFDTVTGFITNTANYSALTEPYITVTDATRQSKWIDFNRYVDELSFAKAFRTKLISKGFNAGIGMLIDTSRNGWGGPNRPTKASTASDVDTMINESRVDRRFNTGNWCNQSGAGLGERPQVVNADGIDAYVWIKPPGESDGASAYIPNDQGKGADSMCDPTYTGNARNNKSMSGALADAPLSGAWFSAQFQELMANAYPPLK